MMNRFMGWMGGSIAALCVFSMGCASTPDRGTDPGLDVAGAENGGMATRQGTTGTTGSQDMASGSQDATGGTQAAQDESVDVYSPPGTGETVARKEMQQPAFTNEGNDARNRGLGGGLNPSGQAGPENQASGINTPAHRSELGKDVQAKADRKGPITDVMIIMVPTQDRDLIGQQVEFTRVNVQSVVSDRGFFVGPDKNQRVYAMLDEGLDAGLMEWWVRVKQNRQVTLFGELREVPDQDQLRGGSNLNDKDMSMVRSQGYYIHVTRIDLHDGRGPIDAS